MDNELTSWDSKHIKLATAAELQDNLMSASNDLERLQTLLADACDTLMQRFYGATQHVQSLHEMVKDNSSNEDQNELYQMVLQHLGGAVTALQFQDMASQLIIHTNQRLRNCADTLAHEAFGADGDGEAFVTPPPLKPNPVTQSEMDAGSVEFF